MGWVLEWCVVCVVCAGGVGDPVGGVDGVGGVEEWILQNLEFAARGGYIL
jgi:hypothetical protein